MANTPRTWTKKTANTEKRHDPYADSPKYGKIKNTKPGAYDTIGRLEAERRGKKIQRKK